MDVPGVDRRGELFSIFAEMGIAGNGRHCYIGCLLRSRADAFWEKGILGAMVLVDDSVYRRAESLERGRGCPWLCVWQNRNGNRYDSESGADRYMDWKYIVYKFAGGSGSISAFKKAAGEYVKFI